MGMKHKVIDAYLCNDGTWRVPDREFENDAEREQWQNSFLWQVIPFMWERYKARPELLFKQDRIYTTVA